MKCGLADLVCWILGIFLLLMVVLFDFDFFANTFLNLALNVWN